MKLAFVGNKAKGRISKQVFQRTYEYQGVRNVRFLGKFGVLCFLEIPVLRFALLPYYWRIIIASNLHHSLK